MYHSFLSHSSADGHLGCFQVLAIINGAEMNIGVHVSLSILISLVCMPSSGIAGLYGSSVYSFLRSLHRRRQWQPTPVLLPGKSHGWRSLVGFSPWVLKSRTRLSDFPCPFHFHALEKEMATHSSVLAWRIPGTGEPHGLPSMGSHRVGHD